MNNEIVTYTKATGILLMVFCHSLQNILLYKYVYMFHMPIFFIMAGYCFSIKYYTKPHIFIWKRIKRLYWNFLKFNILFLLFHNIFYKLHFYEIPYPNDKICKRIIGLTTSFSGEEMLLGGYWFLRYLFWGSIFAFFVLFLSYYIHKEKCDNQSANIMKLIIIIAVCYIVNRYYIVIPFFNIGPQALLVAALFIVGHIIHCSHFRQFKTSEIIMSALLVGVGAKYWQMETGLPFFYGKYIVPYIFTATLGTWSIYSLPWQKMTNKAKILMDYIGSHTLSILSWHFLSFKIVSFLIIILYNLPYNRLLDFPIIVEYANRGWFILYFLTGIVVPLIMSYLYDNKKVWLRHVFYR